MSKEICDKMKNIGREPKPITKNQKEILELKNTVIEIRTANRWV